MIEVQNLSKKYGSIRAVNNLSFTIQKGEIVGFLGPNGAGKSTTMNMITGYLSSSEGSVKVCGYDVLENPKEVKKRVGYLPEQPPLYMDMTVDEYLKFVCDLKMVDKKVRKTQIDDILELVKISNVRHRLIKNLSKGYKQRVGLAQALIGNPEVLILDEPTVGLDPKQIIEIRKLIKALGKEHTIILSSHILPEVSAVCERVVIINKGQIAAIDTPENLSKNFDSSTKFTISIEGPKDEVQGMLKGVEGVKYAEASSKTEGDVQEFIVEASKDVDVKRPIFFELAKAGYPILELKSLDLSLEDIFLQITTQENTAAGSGQTKEKVEAVEEEMPEEEAAGAEDSEAPGSEEEALDKEVE